MDIEPYFAIKEIGRNIRKTKMEYWIEESFAIYLSSYVWLEIITAFYEVCNIEVPPIENDMRTEADIRKEKYIHDLLCDVEITKPEHIDYYMDPKNIVELINSTKLIF